ncbi:Lipase maturation factor 1 [Geodia barretti]|uniref:Lipase maturation factor n=1 Tax=Geodia barretti TaxID=519541 RepID=A0AA35TXM3_GEOBA|nr:Lipase maturation factor 1 [Geodia barretti]
MARGGAEEGSGEVRKRKRRKRAKDDGDQERETSERPSDSSRPLISTEKKEKRREIPEKPTEIQPGSYWLTRIVFIRALGFVYFAAFLVALNQNKELVGKNGLLPTPSFLARWRQHLQMPDNVSVTMEAVKAVPTLMWWVPEEDTDLALDAMAYTGLAISGVLVLFGAGNAVMFTILWALYHSIINVGQTWYHFGWESQLLETGFLAIFLSPVFSLRRLPQSSPTSWTVVWGYRWLLFRLMLGAGLIKIRLDPCWKDLTCMNYHYQTQPVPNPISYYLHQTPESVHKMETLANHAVELVAPFLLVLPRPIRTFGGIVQVLFQVVLIVSGNLSFLNWLTLVPAVMSFDDKTLGCLFSVATRRRVIDIQYDWKTRRKPIRWYFSQLVSLALAGLIGYLSIPVVQNMLSSNQIMNTSFNKLKIVNSYGHFGSITRERTEIVLEGTFNSSWGEDAGWLEVEFKCKPGAIGRRPCFISPYHYRLDWLMWFAAFQDYNRNPWMLNLASKILAGDPTVDSLLAYNPFSDKPPTYIRARHYLYRYTEWDSVEALRGNWWKRDLLDELYFPVVAEEHLRPFVEDLGFHWYTRGEDRSTD